MAARFAPCRLASRSPRQWLCPPTFCDPARPVNGDDLRRIAVDIDEHA
jgi:hypothetical protein